MLIPAKREWISHSWTGYSGTSPFELTNSRVFFLREEVIKCLIDLECPYSILDVDGTPMLEISDDTKGLLFKLTV
jgi:hypothetical protein